MYGSDGSAEQNAKLEADWKKGWRPDVDKYQAEMENIHNSTTSIYGQKLSDIGEVLANGNVKGKYSGREFDPNKAGGAILDLDWKGVEMTQQGLESIKTHLSRFGKSSQNTKAIQRIQDILDGKLQVTEYDEVFYTHELREYERYKNIGIQDGVDDPEAWNNCHAATLEDYKINEKSTKIYHPETEPTIEDLLNER